MVDWNTGKPNSRIRVLSLLRENFGPGDKIVEAAVDNPYFTGLAVVTKAGKRKMLLVNKRDRNLDLALDGVAGSRLDYVDVTTGFQPPASVKLDSDKLTIHGFSVGVLIFP